MNMLNDVDDPQQRLKILKALLSTSISNNEVLEIIQEQIDALENGQQAESTEEENLGELEDSEEEFDVLIEWIKSVL